MTREEDKAGHDWSELPWELLTRIAQRLTILKDKIRIRAVCKTWRKGLAQQLPLMFRQSSPLLMLPYCSSNNKGEEDDDAGVCCGSQCRLVLDIAHNQFHHINFGEGLKEANCRGSAFGWMFMLQRIPVLYNPLTGNRISLPPITSFPEMVDYRPELVGEEYLLQWSDGTEVVSGKRWVESVYVERIAMSAEPTAEECVVMALCLCDNIGRLAFCKPGDDKWTLIPDLPGLGLANIVFCRNNFYAVNCSAKVLICDLSVPKMSFLVSETSIICLHSSYLLSGPDDELMLLSRITGNEVDLACIYSDEDNGFPIPHVHQEEEEEEEEEEDVDDHEDDEAGVLYVRDSDDLLRRPFMYSTLDFRVFKLNKDTNQWDQVKTIGDHALFIGANAPACLSTKDYPRFKPNCIYFTDDYYNAQLKGRHAGYDMGIYHLSDDTVELICCDNSYYERSLVWPPPVWISPSLH